MSEQQVWIITGAGRGLGTEIATVALEAGHNVVATGRNTEAVTAALGQAANLLVAKLDITSPQDAHETVAAAVEHFGTIDVLVNNAANFYAGFFEELTPDQVERQISTSLYGPMNVTRAVLPVMRKQRSGHIITISSSAGLVGFEFGAAYAASKFGLEGWMQSMRPEVERFGIKSTVVNPGFFRTELLTKESTNFAPHSIDDYAAAREPLEAYWTGQNGQQAGDPVKLAHALVQIAELPIRLSDSSQVPMRLPASNKLPPDSSRTSKRIGTLSTSLAIDGVS